MYIINPRNCLLQPYGKGAHFITTDISELNVFASIANQKKGAVLNSYRFILHISRLLY